MQAKDTVMKGLNNAYEIGIALAQAETSFPLGFEEGRKVGIRVGAKQIANWCETHNLKLPTTKIPLGEPINIDLKDCQEWQTILEGLGVAE